MSMLKDRLVIAAIALIVTVVLMVFWRESRFQSAPQSMTSAAAALILFGGALLLPLAGAAVRWRPLRVAFFIASLAGCAGLVSACLTGVTAQNLEYGALLYGNAYLPAMFILLGAFVAVHVGLALRLPGRRA